MYQYTKIMQVIVCFFIFCLCKGLSNADVPKSEVVKCAVCRSLVFEIHKAISKVDPRKKVEIGSFRINPNGEQERSSRKYAGSEAHMTELLETVCQEFADYAQARHKETNEIDTIKLVEDGVMNPKFNEYEIIQDPDLNKGVQFHCESIVEDFEDELLKYFAQHAEVDADLSKTEFCSRKTKLCSTVKQEL